MHPILRATLLGLAAIPVFGSPASGAEGPAASSTLYLFLAPDSPGGDTAVLHARDFVHRHEGEVSLRIVLLVERFGDLRHVTEQSPITKTLRALGDPGTWSILLYDPEGLGLAEAWQIHETPSAVLVARDRAHRTWGSEALLEPLWECDR